MGFIVNFPLPRPKPVDGGGETRYNGNTRDDRKE